MQEAQQITPDIGSFGAQPSTKRKRSRYFAIRKPLPVKTSTALSVCFFVLLLAGWTLATNTGWVSDFFLPRPMQVLQAAWGMYVDNGFLWDIAVSIYRVLVGFCLAALIAVPLGLLMGSVQFFRSFLNPALPLRGICRRQRSFRSSFSGLVSTTLRSSRLSSSGPSLP